MSNPKVEAALRAIADANDGRITPDNVVEAARDEASPLHGFFTWDVEKAAYERLLDQAAKLIRTVKIEVRTTHFTVMAPAYVRDPSLPSDERGYTTLARLRSGEDAAREAVVAEFVRASAALARAKALAVALDVVAEIEAVESRILMLQEGMRQSGASGTA